MREEAKKIREHTIAQVRGYHCGHYQNHLVFSSDRPNEADRNYRLLNGDLLALFGIEWETQVWGITSPTIYANVLRDIVFSKFHSDLWKIEEDGSLRRNCDSSAECISQPMTKAYIRNNYRNFKYMWEKALALGINCEQTGQCGMHTHISLTCFGRTKATQDEAIRKFLYIINKHYDLMMKLFYRQPSSYCPQMPNMTDKKRVKKANLARFDDDHYVCINMGHYSEGNIELRLVGGQKDYPCFRNTMECIFHIVDRCKHISWTDADSIVEIFKGCNQYVYDRLSSYVREAGQISSEELRKIRVDMKMENLI